MKASSAGGEPVRRKAQHRHREGGEHHAEGERIVGLQATGRDRPPAGALHPRVDVGVVPHVERARGAGADGDSRGARSREHRREPARRGSHADERREDDQRHDARLQERDVVLDVGAAPVRYERFVRVACQSHVASLGRSRRSCSMSRLPG